ncbi:MAG: glycosyltransferase [Myxococcota bacterium]
MRPAVCVVGHYERDYPRNVIVRRWLEALGYRVVECHSTTAFPWRHAVLAAKYLAVRKDVAGVWAAEGGHRLVPLLKLWTRLAGHRLIFDPFISRYDTRVNDRGWYRPGSLQARIARWQDWSSCRAADHLVFDTFEHADYFRSQYGIRAPHTVLEVAVDEELFRPAEPPPQRDTTEVLFYGTYIPLHGIETILDAAAALRTRPDITLTLIGKGQEYAGMRARADAAELSNVAFVDPMSPAALVRRIAAADICLGIFGTSRKAGSVVPNKVVQCAAMAKPMITRESTAVRRYFDDGQTVVLTPPADAGALAGAIERLAGDPATRRRIGNGARAVFEARFSAAALRPRLLEILRANGIPAPDPAPR